jgi:hypothetical protein
VRVVVADRQTRDMRVHVQQRVAVRVHHIVAAARSKIDCVGVESAHASQARHAACARCRTEELDAASVLHRRHLRLQLARARARDGGRDHFRRVWLAAREQQRRRCCCATAGGEAGAGAARELASGRRCCGARTCRVSTKQRAPRSAAQRHAPAARAPRRASARTRDAMTLADRCGAG